MLTAGSGFLSTFHGSLHSSETGEVSTPKGELHRASSLAHIQSEGKPNSALLSSVQGDASLPQETVSSLQTVTQDWKALATSLLGVVSFCRLH